MARIPGSRSLNSIIDRLRQSAQASSSAPAAAPAAPAPSVDNYAATQRALDLLAPVIQGLKVNDLNAYVGENSRVRQDFIRDEDYIRSALDEATNRAYDVQRAQALQDASKAEDTNYRNTQNAIAEMRRNLIGSGSSGANVGAANATALQALLGLGQQNTEATTEGLRNINNVSKERAAQIAQNAVEAISQANDATAKMYDAATSSYASDRSYAAQGASEAISNLIASADASRAQERQTEATNAANERMNAATANANIAAAQLAQNTTQTVINKTSSSKKKKK